MRRYICWTDFLLCLVLVWAAEVRAQTAERDCMHIQKCKAHYKHGLQAYEDKRYEDAIREFQAAYQIKQEPKLLLLVGRLYFNLGDAREALRYYDQFQQVESNPDSESKNKLPEYIAQALADLTPESSVPDQRPIERAPAPEQALPEQIPPAQATVPPAAPQMPMEAAKTGLVVRQERPLRGRRPAWRIATGITSGVLGVGLVGFGASALSVAGQCIGSPCLTQYDTVGAGAGLVAGGIILIGGGMLLLALPGSKME